MKRSAGITVSAILAMVGSVAVLGMAGLVAIIGIVMRLNPALLTQQEGIAPSPVPVLAVMFIESAVFLIFGVFGSSLRSASCD